MSVIGQPVFLAKRHVDARHERKMERHVALIAIAKVGAHVGRPLVGLGKNQAIRIVRVDRGAQRLDHRVRFRQIFAGGSIALAKVWNRVHAQRVDAHVEPEAHRLQHLFHHQRVVVVQVGLVREKAMPVIGLGSFVPGPVRFFRIGKDDARVLILLSRCPTRRTCRARPIREEPGAQP